MRAVGERETDLLHVVSESSEPGRPTEYEVVGRSAGRLSADHEERLSETLLCKAPHLQVGAAKDAMLQPGLTFTHELANDVERRLVLQVGEVLERLS
jgi:hypothetical protein